MREVEAEERREREKFIDNQRSPPLEVERERQAKARENSG
jgi:hypothetical protein